MQIHSYLVLVSAAMLAITTSLSGMQSAGEGKEERSPAAKEARGGVKTEALTVKQKAATKGAAGSSKPEADPRDTSAAAPIGVNEPGVNRAAKPSEWKAPAASAAAPIGVNEPGVNRAAKPKTGSEDVQPMKGQERTIDATNQAGPRGKSGGDKPQAAKGSKN